MTIQSQFPASRPSLLLDFANAKRLDPRVTFTRASTARFYDGTTVAKAEENLFLQSQTFGTSWVGTFRTVTENTTAAPDGTTTADSIIETAANGEHNVVQAFTSVTGQTYVISVFAKANTRTKLILRNNLVSSSYRNNGFDLSAGTVTRQATGFTASIVNAGGGWYRCIVIGTADSARTVNIGFCLTTTDPTDDSDPIYTGDGTSGLYLWGAQLERRSSVTAYTPTTTAPITNYIPVLQTAASGQARFDHNPVTGESLGLLIEESRTNLVTYSEQFNDASWAKTNSTVQSNTAIAPDGTLTGDSFLDVNAGAYAEIRRVLAFTSGTAYSFSVYAKAGTRRYLYLSLGTRFASATEAIFDLQTGVVKSQGVGATTATISSVGNGFYRCAITATANSTGNGEAYFYHTNDAGTSIFYTGTGTGSIFLWGAQVEAGTFPTSYIQTVAASATRQADAASMTGANFTSWFDATEGTLFAEAIFATDGTNPSATIASMSNNTTNDFITIRMITGVTRFAVRVATVDQANIGISGAVINTPYRFAATYKVNDFAFCRDAGTVGTDTSGTIPVVSQMLIGATGTAGTNLMTGTIRKISYYPVRLPDAQLQALTR